MKSLAQRALDCMYPAQQIAQNVAAVYWLASLSNSEAHNWAYGRMREVEKHLKEIANTLGYKIERIENEVRPAPAPEPLDDSIPF